MPAASVSAVATVGRWCPHSFDHPAALRAPARTRRDHAAPTPHRGRGRAHRLPEPGRRHGHAADADGARSAPTTATIATADPSSALAWSEDDASEDVLPYSDVTDSRPEVHFRHEEWQDAQPPRRGHWCCSVCRRSPRPSLRPCSASPCSATPPPLRSKGRPPRPPPPRLRRRPVSQLPRRRRPPK